MKNFVMYLVAMIQTTLFSHAKKSGLVMFAVDGEAFTVGVAATADLRTFQYKIVACDGTLAASNAVALGVLQNKPNTGESATVKYMGHLKAYVGGAVAANDHLAVTTSGWLIKNVTSTSGIVGKVLTDAASGAICEFVGNFPTTRNSYSIGIL